MNYLNHSAVLCWWRWWRFDYAESIIVCMPNVWNHILLWQL